MQKLPILTLKGGIGKIGGVFSEFLGGVKQRVIVLQSVTLFCQQGFTLMEFATIVDEVVQQFITKIGVDVTISVEVQARSSQGFDEPPAAGRQRKLQCHGT